MISPRQFRKLELPALRRILSIASECVGHPLPCIMGGKTSPIVDELLSTGTSFLVSNPETDQRPFVEAVSRTHVKVRVNMDSGIVAGSDTERIHREIDRILEFAGGRPNCLLGTGALPYERLSGASNQELIMNEHPTCTPGRAADPPVRCEECGAFGASQFAELLLCADCYVGKGSCFPEFGEDDLWARHEEPTQHRAI